MSILHEAPNIWRRAERDVRVAPFEGLQRMASRAGQHRARRRAQLAAEGNAERDWFWRMVKLEVERSRRTDQPFTILCMRGLRESEATAIADRLRPHLRGTDVLLAERDAVFVLLSETSGDRASSAAARLVRLGGGVVRGSQVAIVDFPQDAITFGALVQRLLDPTTGAHLSIAG